MSSEVQVAIIAGAFAVLGTVIGAGLTFLFSLLEKRREDRRRAEEAAERESAVFHGAFALSNYIASRLNDWDEFRSVHVLQRLQVAQPYLAKLIDRSPPESERLMVSLIDVGLQLEGLLSLVGFLLGLEDEEAITESSENSEAPRLRSSQNDLLKMDRYVSDRLHLEQFI